MKLIKLFLLDMNPILNRDQIFQVAEDVAVASAENWQLNQQQKGACNIYTAHQLSKTIMSPFRVNSAQLFTTETNSLKSTFAYKKCQKLW